MIVRHLHHEEISGFMDEMGAPSLEDPSEYSKLKVGHQYTFDMIVDKDDGTYIRNVSQLEELRKSRLR